MKKSKKRIEFSYDVRGYGDLTLYCGDTVLDRYRCRTGSINKSGILVNAITAGNFVLFDKSVDTDEEGMSVVHGVAGWKIRLYRDYGEEPAFTRYLIHPDGGKPGTKGCLGIQGTNAVSFRHELDAALDEQAVVPVKIAAGDWL